MLVEADMPCFCFRYRWSLLSKKCGSNLVLAMNLGCWTKIPRRADVPPFCTPAMMKVGAAFVSCSLLFMSRHWNLSVVLCSVTSFALEWVGGPFKCAGLSSLTKEKLNNKRRKIRLIKTLIATDNRFFLGFLFDGYIIVSWNWPLANGTVDRASCSLHVLKFYAALSCYSPSAPCLFSTRRNFV